MKKFLFIMLLSFTGLVTLTSVKCHNLPSTALTIISSNFDEGWKDGYCEGWRDVKGQNSICPITPIAPIPPIGYDSYKGGYNMGFKAGRRAASN